MFVLCVLCSFFFDVRAWHLLGFDGRGLFRSRTHDAGGLKLESCNGRVGDLATPLVLCSAKSVGDRISIEAYGGHWCFLGDRPSKRDGSLFFFFVDEGIWRRNGSASREPCRRCARVETAVRCFPCFSRNHREAGRSFVSHLLCSVA